MIEMKDRMQLCRFKVTRMRDDVKGSRIAYPVIGIGRRSVLVAVMDRIRGVVGDGRDVMVAVPVGDDHTDIYAGGQWVCGGSFNNESFIWG